MGLRRAIVVAQKATDALATPNAPAGMLVSRTIDQLVAEALMVAFVMIVDRELLERTTEVALTLRNHAVQAFFFNRTNKPLGVRITVWRAKRCPDHGTPDVSSRCRTAVPHFRSRSQIS